MEKCLIVAVAGNNAIGVRGGLPWHISEDLKFFKATTSGYPVIMGRKTWDSLPFKPLKGRRNIVLSRSTAEFEGAIKVGNLEEAFHDAEGAEKCFVIGGESIYRLALEEVDTLYITLVHTTITEADAYFPVISKEDWEESDRSDMKKDPETGLEFEFITYRRK